MNVFNSFLISMYTIITHQITISIYIVVSIYVIITEKWKKFIDFTKNEHSNNFFMNNQTNF